MNRIKLQDIVRAGAIEWRKHALERMFQRNIARAEVKEALLKGEIIEVYEDDKPFESALFLYVKYKPLHVVASLDEKGGKVYIITTYRPDSVNFEDDFKTRRTNDNR